MKHLNGNMLCALDVETSGRTPGHHDILEICVLPLDFTIRPSKEFLPFNIYMQPSRPDNIDLEALKVQPHESLVSDDIIRSDDPTIKDKKLILDICNRGMDPYYAAERFVEWFENLRLAPNKRIAPLGHNLQFDLQFVMDWLGFKTFNMMFDARTRDTMLTAIFENDRCDFNGSPYKYQKFSLSSIAGVLEVENPCAHTALGDCITTAECYRRMIHRSGRC